MKSTAALTRILVIAISFISSTAFCAAKDPDLYQIKIYQLKTKEQEARVEKFLQDAWVPAMHRAGIARVGVFKPLANDTAASRYIYVLIPMKSTAELISVPEKLAKDEAYLAAGKEYLDAVYTDPPYTRIESVLLQAFPEMTHYDVPSMKANKPDRIYELRSYEGPTEKIHQNKVDMFNKGDEVGLFKRLGFNAVFYAEVISGSHMPNLMYMTCFENQAEHDGHWKAFGEDPYWKKLSAQPEYQHNVSSITITLLHPAAYSDF